MSHATNAVCFTCGLAITSPPQLNRLTSGKPCPACRDRVLDMLPGPLPTRAWDARPREAADELQEFDRSARTDDADEAS